MSYLDDWTDEHNDAAERRQRQLGTRWPQCPTCIERDPFSLTGNPAAGCYECAARAVGRSVIEGHHVQGRANDADDVVAIPGNDHRWLSACQQQWPIETLRNPDASPLLRAAAAIRGWLDVLALILDRSVGWAPAFLEWLDAALRDAIGITWWATLGWQG